MYSHNKGTLTKKNNMERSPLIYIAGKLVNNLGGYYNKKKTKLQKILVKILALTNLLIIFEEETNFLGGFVDRKPSSCMHVKKNQLWWHQCGDLWASHVMLFSVHISSGTCSRHNFVYSFITRSCCLFSMCTLLMSKGFSLRRGTWGEELKTRTRSPLTSSSLSLQSLHLRHGLCGSSLFWLLQHQWQVKPRWQVGVWRGLHQSHEHWVGSTVGALVKDSEGFFYISSTTSGESKLDISRLRSWFRP